MEVGAMTVKDVSAAAVGKEEARIVSIADYELRLRREGSIASQAATDTPPAGGSIGSRTPEAIFWSIGETLSRLGEKWLGNPFTTLASLIPTPTMAEVRAITPQETTNHMIFHFTDVSVSCFDPDGYLFFKRLIPSFVLQGFMNGIDYFFKFWRS
jgi:hypothetical protein